MKKQIAPLAVGIYFGIVLVKSEVASWLQIQKMFHFEDPYMYLVIASAIVVGILSLQIMKRLHLKTVGGEIAHVPARPYHKGIIGGSLIFGMGWALTGACPGPIYAQIGSGSLLAIITFISALVGVYLYALLQPKLPH